MRIVISQIFPPRGINVKKEYDEYNYQGPVVRGVNDIYVRYYLFK